MEIPSDAIDVSTFRQIPDTQEVFLLEKSSGLDQSLIFDLLERVESATLPEIVAVHLDDILDDTASYIAPLESFQNENLECESHSFLVKPGPSKLETEKAKVFMLLVILRVEKVQTDIIITMNVPIETGDVSPEVFQQKVDEAIAISSDAIIGEAYGVINKAATSYKVKNWALFT